MKMQLVCEACGIIFERKKGEVNRSKKLGRKNFCSLKCSGDGNKNNLGSYLSNGKIEHLPIGRQVDEFSPFRYFLKNIRTRHKKHKFADTTITLEDLKILWEKQQGMCPLTGWQMELPRTTTEWNTTNITLKRASLDRIEPRKPYTKGNIRFVCFIANMCKHGFLDGDVIKFCRAVVDKQPI